MVEIAKIRLVSSNGTTCRIVLLIHEGIESGKVHVSAAEVATTYIGSWTAGDERRLLIRLTHPTRRLEDMRRAL